MAQKPKSKLQGIYDKLGIDRSLTKQRYKNKKDLNTVKDNIRLEEDCSFMIDILELPTAPFGFHYLLVCVDIASDEFDIEKMKNKEAVTVLKAFKAMMKRPYLDIPKYYMISDNGNEFKGVFQKYLYDSSIYHKSVLKDRHKQLANIDSLIAMLGRIFIGYLNEKEKETGRICKNWTVIIDIVRKELNLVRKKTLPVDIKKDHSQSLVQTVKNNKFVKPKFKVGDRVYVLLAAPKTILGKDQNTKNFRNGDVTVTHDRREITEVIYMNGKGPVYRYIVEGFKNVSFSDDELRNKL